MAVRYVAFFFLFVRSIPITAWSPHTLFNQSSIETNYTTYAHRLLINRPVEIPCFKPTDGPTGGPTRNFTIYWSHRGFNLTTTGSPFVSAYWDCNGILIINSVLPHQINLWCHLEADNGSRLFIHRLDFIESAYIQTIFAVDMNATLTTNATKAFQEFLFSQKSNCVVQLQGGGISVLKEVADVDLRRAVFQKKAVLDAAQDVCEAAVDCTGVSLDFFQCYIHMGQKTALYSIDFSIMHTVDVGIFVNKDDFQIDKKINQTIMRLSNAVKRTKGRIMSSGFGKIPRTDVNLDINVQNRKVEICLGVAGVLSRSGKAECELCPAGSLSELQITLPPPPDQTVSIRGGAVDSNQETLANMLWPHMGEVTSCRPCPACSYTEILGHPSCLPCPSWHSIPIFGTIPGEGGEWIDLVCPRQGRWQILLNDYVTEAYGYQPVGKWFEELSELTRVWIYVVVAMGSVFFVLAVVIFAYCCVDVAGMLSKSADELRPLYTEAALVVKTTKRVERERTAKAAERLRQLMEKAQSPQVNEKLKKSCC
ncbi:hypothetical protein ECG_06396 [Echinococcus granulosus]|uniref:Uncharacterized protein n=1 Tax=Echinococcus granulosus TaxID=6210 RepID=U6JAN9_ECHGR|nr:hypothetical protein EGR_01139 [Echinococcus granulosus]EUB64011.1 hypothetical protein EGR_01139 [Echinococcus granulosus]KAH9280681.1 hypothetical protein ECG_06396 [Echinococcus granulosus]CDS19516.1 hypothetical protein EgrG_000482900 [Echinococcus granulosus]